MTLNELLRSVVVLDNAAASRESLHTAIQEAAIVRSGKVPIRLIPLKTARQFADFNVGDVFQPNGSDVTYQVVD